MESVFFGISGDNYDSGADPDVAVNASGMVVEVHSSQSSVNPGLWYWLGQVRGTEIAWLGHDTIGGDNGYRPSVAVNGGGVVVEAHDSGHTTLYYWLGRIEGSKVSWKSHDSIHNKNAGDGGRNPSITLNDSGVVVEVHESGAGKLWYWVGQVQGDSVAWLGNGPVAYAGQGADGGYNPSVAIDGAGNVLEVHDSGTGDLWYWIGRVSGSTITWTGHGKYDSGTSPSVALADDGTVIEVHESQGASTGLWQRMGTLAGATLSWGDPLGMGATSYQFDNGSAPAVGLGGRTAVQVHAAQSGSGMWATASLLFDRANWMGDRLGALGATPLNRLAVPASHDSGMYVYGLSTVAKTQALSIYGQLSAGVRYFDFRPTWDGTQFYLYHGSPILEGASLNDALAQLVSFLSAADRRELVMIKVSHFSNIDDQATFDLLCQTFYGSLAPWIYTGPPPAGGRLADTPLGTFVQSRSACLVLMDDTTFTIPSQLPAGAIRIYRDWYASDAAAGDVTVFDVYSDTTDLNEMINGTGPDKNQPGLPIGQLPKFSGYTGICQDGTTPCDLFLLSWTLTPVTDVWAYSQQANAVLGSGLAGVGANRAGRIINMLYTDYLDYARSCDVALVRNGCTAAPAPVAVAFTGIEEPSAAAATVS